MTDIQLAILISKCVNCPKLSHYFGEKLYCLSFTKIVESLSINLFNRKPNCKNHLPKTLK